MDADFADGFCFLQEFVFRPHKEVLNVGAHYDGLFKRHIQLYRDKNFHGSCYQDMDAVDVRSQKKLEEGYTTQDS